MARKTFSVQEFQSQVNNMLKLSVCSAQERLVMCNLLEDVLHNSGNYGGYRYLTETEVPDGHKPGVRYAEDGSNLPPSDRFADCDDSRRYYYVNTNLNL